jgi:hypothetical protein
MTDILKTFTDQVHKMRLAQVRYFDLAAQARKTGIHTKDQKDVLVISKNLETQVDESIKQINAILATPAPAVESQPINKSYFKTENF